MAFGLWLVYLFIYVFIVWASNIIYFIQQWNVCCIFSKIRNLFCNKTNAFFSVCITELIRKKCHHLIKWRADKCKKTTSTQIDTFIALHVQQCQIKPICLELICMNMCGLVQYIYWVHKKILFSDEKWPSVSAWDFLSLQAIQGEKSSSVKQELSLCSQWFLQID